MKPSHQKDCVFLSDFAWYLLIQFYSFLHVDQWLLNSIAHRNYLQALKNVSAWGSHLEIMICFVWEHQDILKLPKVILFKAKVENHKYRSCAIHVKFIPKYFVVFLEPFPIIYL